jgi:hypothetical protein
MLDRAVSGSLLRTPSQALRSMTEGGPKFETSGPFKFFVTGKVGFIRFSESSNAVTFGTVGNAIAGVGGPGTHLALYPGRRP